jgi:NAD(P)-dependent dehydrogenase (short-subunit alcohol dehydrogenase family)
MRLKDTVVIVTGSTSGIGEAIARKAVEEGARVMIHGLEQELGEKVVADLGDHAALHIADLSDPASPERIVAQTKVVFGQLDCIVNNAGWVARSTIETTDAEYFNRVMAVNTRAPVLMIKAALPHLKASQGCVLNIGSVNGYSGEPNFLDYSMSKGALMTMTCNLGDSMHREYGIRVNQINPEWVLTDGEHQGQLAMGNPPDWHTKVPDFYAPSGSLIPPETIASAAIYFMSEESRPISGSVMNLGQFPLTGRNGPKNIF